MLKAVIFDLDNTLYQYDECHETATKKVYEYFSNYKDISYSEYLKKLTQAKDEVKTPLKSTAASHNRLLYFQKLLEMFNIKSIDKADKMYEIYWDSFIDKMTLRKNCLELLEYLKYHNIKVAICSDLTTYIQYKKIRKLNIIEYIDYIVTSEEVGVEKPNFKMFSQTLNKLSVKKDECLYIGDDLKKDIEGAKNFGIEALLIKDDFSNILKEIERRVENV